MDQKCTKIYKNLEMQINKLNKHARQGSFKTRDRYYGGVKKFCKFLAENFHAQKFANISDKHIKAYVEYMQSRYLSVSTIKTNLSSIRYFHDLCPNVRNNLSGNEIYNLERRKFGGVDRTWTNKEYESIVTKAFELGHNRVAYALQLARNEGLRIHEVFRIDRATAEKGIKTGDLTIKGKGGKIRTHIANDKTKTALINAMKDIKRGGKLFVNEGEKTHLVIKETQNFIYNHRKECSDRLIGDVNLTFHGLRHLYAKEQYQNCIAAGMSDYDARKTVSNLLGHERDDVTRIYLASEI